MVETINLKQFKEDFFLNLFNNNYFDLKVCALLNILFDILINQQINMIGVKK